MRRAPLAFYLCSSVFLCGSLFAADWPQFLGPKRNGVSPETGLLDSWPKEGPPRLWQRAVGEGFSGPVVAGDRLIVFHRVGDEEVVECLGAADGKPRWKFAYPTSYQDALAKGDGPRSTPVVAGKQVFTLGAAGRLHGLDLDSGKKLWERSLLEEHRVPPSFFGVGTSPLVEGEIVVINVGGRGAGVVAFHRATGKEVWKATDQGASYASPVAATVDGVRHLIFLTRQGLLSLNPADGAVRFSKPWRARNPNSVNAATPLVHDGHVFVTASYDTGAGLFKIVGNGLEEVWSGDESLSAHYDTPVRGGDYLYGIDGRQESGARLRCVEWKTGKVRWTKEGFGCASAVLADGRLILLTENGELVLAEATPDAYREKARAAVLEGPCRAEIALAHGRLYARDNGKLICLDLKKR